MKMKKVLSIGLAAAMTMSMLTACGSGGGDAEVSADVPALKDITVGEDYQDITATIKVLTDRTDIENDTLLEVLHAVPVQKGDVLFIEAGTIHAIGKNILIAEIQQNSNVTYRVYDYGRIGRDGKKRDLHIEKALAVTNRVPITKSAKSYPHVADCDYFTVDKLDLDGRIMGEMGGNVSEESFVSILMLDGEGVISCGGESVSYKKGDSLFLSAGSGTYQIQGSCDALITSIRVE